MSCLVNVKPGVTGDAASLEWSAGFYNRTKRAVLALDPVKDRESYLVCVQQLTKLASTYHPGLFADPDLERGLLELGRRLGQLVSTRAPEINLPRKCKAPGLHVLHVATMVHSFGGHTATIENWAKTDLDNCHSLFLTRQAQRPVHQGLVTAVHNTGGTIVRSGIGLPDVEVALQLRMTAQQHADLVVLHHHPYDAIPVLAFATTESPPVAVLNHAAHQFWLGSAIADAVINLRGLCAQVSLQRRYARRSLVLPIPLDPDETLPERRASRELLGLSADRNVFLTIGRSDKYLPSRHGDFFRTATKLGDPLRNTTFLCVGLDSKDHAQRVTPNNATSYRFFGTIADTRGVRAAADVYLEGFPFGSHTALLEAGRSGLPVVRSYASPTPLLAAGSEWLDALVAAPRNEADYVDQANRLAEDIEFRNSEGERLKTGLAQYHWGQCWLARLHPIYGELKNIAHAPRELPDLVPPNDDKDIALAQWTSDMKNHFFRDDPDEAARAWLQQMAYWLRNNGAYRAAAKLLWATAVNTRRKKDVFLQLAKLAPHAAIYGKHNGAAKSR